MATWAKMICLVMGQLRRGQDACLDRGKVMCLVCFDWLGEGVRARLGQEKMIEGQLSRGDAGVSIEPGVTS